MFEEPTLPPLKRVSISLGLRPFTQPSLGTAQLSKTCSTVKELLWLQAAFFLPAQPQPNQLVPVETCRLRILYLVTKLVRGESQDGETLRAETPLQFTELSEVPGRCASERSHVGNQQHLSPQRAQINGLRSPQRERLNAGQTIPRYTSHRNGTGGLANTAQATRNFASFKSPSYQQPRPPIYFTCTASAPPRSFVLI